MKIIREEKQNHKYEYAIQEKVQIYLNGDLENEYDRNIFKTEADYLYEKISTNKDRTFSICRTEELMSRIGCTRLAAPSSDKTDITMQIHDIQTGYEPVCGFSIKSEIGNTPQIQFDFV